MRACDLRKRLKGKKYWVAQAERARLAVGMQIEQVDLADATTIRACHEVYDAARGVDTPEDTWLTARPFSGWLTIGWGGDPREVWAVPSEDEGAVAGWYRLELPDKENLDRAYLDLVVPPAARRHGIGRALLRHAAGRAAAHDRVILGSFARAGSPGEAFAR
jgi:GNAT superfamily N-acetyltransferase